MVGTMTVVKSINNNKLRLALLRIAELAGPDNCAPDILELLEEALAMTEGIGEEKAPIRGLCLSYQFGAPGALHHPGRQS